MSTNSEELSLRSTLKQDSEKAYGKEIFFALLVKFLLLGCLWWVFFHGHKQTVDGDVIAHTLFNEHILPLESPASRSTTP